MRDGHLRDSLARPGTLRQLEVLAAYVTAGGSLLEAAEHVGIRPSTVKRHLADLRARSGLQHLSPCSAAPGGFDTHALAPARAHSWIGPYHPRGTGESGRQLETRPPDAACINRGNSSESSMARA